MANQKTKKKTVRKPGQTARKRQSKNLPEPIETVAASTPESQPVKSAGGLLSDINNLFSVNADNPGSQSQSAVDSSTSSISNCEQLSQESERLLAAVPEKIGGEADDPGGPADVPEPDPITALMAQIAFEPQDVQDVIAEFFDWLAERFESDHWKLTDRQARMLGRPAAQLLNSMWARLQNYLPDILARWCEETPGATAFIMACGIVVVPKVTQQVKISRGRKKKKPLVQDKPQRSVQPIRTVNDARPQFVHESPATSD